MPETNTTVNVPASTPTIGAMIGAGIAAVLTPKLGPTAVFAQPAIVGFFTWLFHWGHSKLGTPE
jgi:hypothetical protein